MSDLHPERPFDCPDESGNGSGCLPLQSALVEQTRQAERVARVEARIGQLKVSVDAAKDAADRAEAASTRAAESADTVRRVVCAPANDALARYQSDHAELLPADEGDSPVPTSVSIHVPHLAERRIKREQDGRESAERSVAHLEAENARLALQTQLEMARLKLRATAIGAAVALAGIAGGVLTAWLR